MSYITLTTPNMFQLYIPQTVSSVAHTEIAYIGACATAHTQGQTPSDPTASA